MAITLIPVVVAAIFGHLLYLAYKSLRRPDNFPPGPTGIPILGSFHYLKKYPERDMLKLAKRYGNIFSLKLVEKNFVCVCGMEANRDVLTSTTLCDRRVIYIFRLVKGEKPTGIVHNRYGDELLAYRELLHKVLVAEENFVKKTVHSAVRTDISEVIEQFKSLSMNKEAIFFSTILEKAFFNILLTVLFGKRMDQFDNGKVLELKEAIYKLPKLYVDKLFQLPEIVPFLEKIWLPKSAREFLAASKTIIDFIEDEVDSHEKTFDSKQSRDLVDCFLSKIRCSDLDKPVFTRSHLIMIVFDIFMAGTENSAKLTQFAVLYLAGNEKIQDKILSEIEEVIKSKPNLGWDDRTAMQYTYATTHEILRFANLAPNGVPRKATTDITFHGYSIPKGTVFLLNSYSSHFQEKKWKNAKTFDPENFLNENGEFQTNDAFMPFGGGLRKCPGAPLVKEHLFTLLVNLVRNFKILPESKEAVLDFDPLPGLVPTPKRQKVRFILRK